MADHVGSRKHHKTASPTTLSAQITDTATTIPGTSFAGWPSPAVGEYAAAIIGRNTDTQEVIWYTSRTDSTLSGVERGMDGTTAVIHAANTAIEHCPTASDFEESNLHVTDVTRHDHTQYPRRTQGETITANWTFTGTPTFTAAEITALTFPASPSPTVTGAPTFSGNVTFSGTPVLNAATVTTDLVVGDDLTVAGDLSVTGPSALGNVTANAVTATDATFTNSPEMPMGGTPTELDSSTAAAGTSEKPAREDHKHAIDVADIETAMTAHVKKADVPVNYATFSGNCVAGEAIFAHGITDLHKKMISVIGGYKGPSNEFIPFDTYNYVDSTNVKFAHPTAGTNPYYVRILYSTAAISW